MCVCAAASLIAASLICVDAATWAEALAESASSVRTPMSADVEQACQPRRWLGGHSIGLCLLTWNTHGTMVGSVQAGGLADRAGLKPGDVVMQLDDAPVPSPVEVAEKIDAAEAGGKTAIALTVGRNGRQYYVALRLHP